MLDRQLKIGALAARSGVNVQTVRYYERCGLLPRPMRSATGYRLYNPDTVRHIRFIKNAQQVGFSLAEVRELLRLRSSRRSTCRQVRVIAGSKKDALVRQIAALRLMATDLERLLNLCERESAARECPIIGALDEGNWPDHEADSRA